MNELKDINGKKNLTLVIGGTRSGKSSLAESMARDSMSTVYYMATMRRWENDQESFARIERHRRLRSESWVTIESPANLHKAVQDLPAGPGFVLIECLSLYVSNLLLEGHEEGADPYAKEEVIASAIGDLCAAIDGRQDLEFAIVTNEVGLGVVPGDPLSRAYRDLLGISNQTIAAQANSVWLIVAGCELRLK